MFLGFSFAGSSPKRTPLGRMVNQSTMLLMGVIGTLILVLALLILFHENRNATKGYRLRKLEADRSASLLEQEILNMQIAQAQALETLRNSQTVSAMVNVKTAQYVKLAPSVAQEPLAPSVDQASNPQ